MISILYGVVSETVSQVLAAAGAELLPGYSGTPQANLKALGEPERR
jgi:hypothetical protein